MNTRRILTLLLALAAAPSLARAQPSLPPGAPPAPPPAPPGETPEVPEPPPAPGRPPTTAVAALDRANAAYEYGDMKEVVESARPVVDGALEATLAERVQALRLLGIGLYLTGRPTGAENAFLELLRNRPKARLDPTTTRPEVVAFFEDVRRRHRSNIEDAARARSRKSMIWNFLPPVGQFKNGDNGRGFLILGVGVASAAGAITTSLLLNDWCIENRTCPGAPGATMAAKTSTANTVQNWNYISVGVLAATYAAGVVDAFLRSDREPEEAERSVSFFVFPGGAGLGGRF
jgi:hypothetical protein